MSLVTALQYHVTLCLEATIMVTHAELVLRRAALLEQGHLAQREPCVAHGESPDRFETFSTGCFSHSL